MFKLLTAPAAALLLGLGVSATSASAAPLTGSAAVIDHIETGHVAGDVELVGGRHRACRRHYAKRYDRRVRHRHAHNGRTVRCRQYNRRPHDWRRRGCFAVGPIWVCP